MSEKQRVVVTGIGIATSIGLDETTFWNNLVAGRHGIRKLTSLDVSACKTQVGGEIDDCVLRPAIEQRKLQVDDRTAELALLASAQTLEQAGVISGPPYEPKNIASIFGTGVGSAVNLFKAYMSYAEKGIRGMRPTTVPRCMANATTSQISMKFRLTGPNYVIISACSSATIAIGTAFRTIKDGYAEMVLCGGSDAAFEPATFGGWNNLGVMSRNPDPGKACRPFDSARDGCILGEGAGAILLESLESAGRRNVRIRCEITGYGESSDAEHITHPSAEGQAAAMRAAIQSAGIEPSDVSFINAHGTGTKANDETESQSIRLVFGNACDRIPVSANKSYFGHTLGAAGAIETIASILSLEHRMLPSNLNLDNPDPECNLCLVGTKAQEFHGSVAMKNSFGFGGNNAVLILRKFDGHTA